MSLPSPSLTLNRPALLSPPFEQFARLAFVAHCGDPAHPVSDVTAAKGNAPWRMS
ncbi:MAG: hypothetical protein JWP20_1694 [Roseomonas sp.]|nr:hypothetical protein [Roseomonas sp.]